jgi:hypothetical protein
MDRVLNLQDFDHNQVLFYKRLIFILFVLNALLNFCGDAVPAVYKICGL